MYWPVLVHNSCLLIILCGLTTTSHASDTFDTIVERRSAAAAAAAAATAAATASAASPSASAHVNVPPQTLSPSKISSSTISSSSALPSSSILQSQQHTKNIATSTVYHHGSGSHNIESRNSYTMLSQAMSQAVNHEFSKWLLIEYRLSFFLPFFPYLGFILWICQRKCSIRNIFKINNYSAEYKYIIRLYNAIHLYSTKTKKKKNKK